MGEFFAKLILVLRILASQENLDIFWIYFSESPFQKILRGLIFANTCLKKFRMG